MSQIAATSASQGRYRGLIFSITFFMLLIAGLLALTFYSSSVLEKNATLSNAAHQVANDTQSLMKDVFDIQLSYGEDVTSPHMKTVLSRLDSTTKSIESTLIAIETQGVYHDSHGDGLHCQKSQMLRRFWN